MALSTPTRVPRTDIRSGLTAGVNGVNNLFAPPAIRPTNPTAGSLPGASLARGSSAVPPVDPSALAQAGANRSVYLQAHNLTAHDANATGEAAAMAARTPIGIVDNGYIYKSDVGKTINATGSSGGTYIAPAGSQIFASTGGGASAARNYGGGGGAGGAYAAYGGAGGGGALKGASLGGGSFGPGGAGGGAGYAYGPGGIPAALQAAQNAANAANEARYQEGKNLLQTGGADQLAKLDAGYADLLGQANTLSDADLTRAQRATQQDVASATARFYGMGLANTTGATMALEGVKDRGAEREQVAADANTKYKIGLGQTYIGQQQAGLQQTRDEQAQWIYNKNEVGPNASQWSQLLSQPGATGGGYGGGNSGGGGGFAMNMHPGPDSVGDNAPGPNNGGYYIGGGAGSAAGSTMTPPTNLAGSMDGTGGGDFAGQPVAGGTVKPWIAPGTYSAGGGGDWAPPLPGQPTQKQIGNDWYQWADEWQEWVPV